MRLTRLLMATLLVVTAGTTVLGQDSGGRSKSKQARTTGSSPAGTRAADDSAQSNVCLALRTMVVARDEKQSDATHLVSQRTCTPARQFQMKSAVVSAPK